MKFGLNLGDGGPAADPRTMAELANLAEASGWEGVYLEDYIVYQNQTGTPTYDPWVTLAAMAMRTRRIRLGTTVTPLPRRRVAKLAAEAVTLDHLSGGRLTLGLGLGDAWDVALANLGEQTDARVRRSFVDEGLEVLVGLWSGQPFTHHGRFHHVDTVTLLPRPVQSPRIPIWIGGHVVDRVGSAGRSADDGNGDQARPTALTQHFETRLRLYRHEFPNPTRRPRDP